MAGRLHWPDSAANRNECCNGRQGQILARAWPGWIVKAELGGKTPDAGETRPALEEMPQSQEGGGRRAPPRPYTASLPRTRSVPAREKPTQRHAWQARAYVGWAPRRAGPRRRGQPWRRQVAGNRGRGRGRKGRWTGPAQALDLWSGCKDSTRAFPLVGPRGL